MRVTGHSPHWHRMVALVSLTVTAVVYSEARCCSCNRKLMEVPGIPTVREVTGNGTGRGPVVVCKRCSTMLEVAY